MPAYTPEEVPLLFAQALFAGDLETLMSLYEAEALAANSHQTLIH